MDCPTLTSPLKHCRSHKEGHQNHWAHGAVETFNIPKPMMMTLFSIQWFAVNKRDSIFFTVAAMGGANISALTERF